MLQATPQTNEQSTIDSLTIMPVDDNTWIIQTNNINVKITISLIGNRLKVLLKDNDEYKVPINSYTNSWTYAEMIDKNEFFKFFDDITYIEDIIKSVIDNPRKVSIKGKTNDNQIFVILTLPTRNNNQLILDLMLLEKSEEERQLEEQKLEEVTRQKMKKLEQGIFNLAMELKEITDKNQLEWTVNDFPEDVKERCRKTWIENNPTRTIPWT
jgi:hypothetical protein